MTTDLQQNRYDRLIRRVGGIIGPGSKVGEVITELFPMIDVENVPGELLALMGTNLCMGGGVIAAVAAEAPKMQLVNPTDSGTLITLTSVWVSTSGGSLTMRWGTTATSLAAAANRELFRDTRLGITNRPTGQIHEASSAGFGPATMQCRTLNNTPLKLEDKNGIVVLAPGDNWQIGVGSNNVDLLFALYWRERVAEASELNF